MMVGSWVDVEICEFVPVTSDVVLESIDEDMTASSEI
jgi:hypothetical protein